MLFFCSDHEGGGRKSLNEAQSKSLNDLYAQMMAKPDQNLQSKLERKNHLSFIHFSFNMYLFFC